MKLFPLAAAALLAMPLAAAQAGALDGRSFEGVVLEKGKTRGDADTLVFKDGRFRSTACDRYGFGDAPYTAVMEGETVRFEAETASPRYGRLKWTGYVRGERADATAIWLREGKAPVAQWYVGELKK